MSDGIDLSTVQIHNSHDVKSWPATATITKLEFRPTGVHVEHTRNHGPASWPNFRPPGWDGDLQYTLWIFLQHRRAHGTDRAASSSGSRAIRTAARPRSSRRTGTTPPTAGRR